MIEGQAAPAQQGLVVWSPNPGAQTRLITCPCNEVLYGGAKGGGKSDGILGDWMAHLIRNPKYARGIIFRKSFPELEQLIERSTELFKHIGGHYKAHKKTWIFPGGARLKFRFCDNVRDAKRYQGHEYTWIAFDEVGEIGDVEIVNVLRGAIRTSKPVTERRLVLGGNPLGEGHAWLKERFITGMLPDVPVLERMSLPPMAGMPAQEITWSRVFIPATIEENPKLLQKDPGYLLRLEQMCAGKPGLYRALRYGDWTAELEIEGALFLGKHIEDMRIERASLGLLELNRIAIGLDPSGSGKPDADECGMVVAGGGLDRHKYTLKDASLRAPVATWARSAAKEYRYWADQGFLVQIVVETNFGGGMAREVLLGQDGGLQIIEVNVTKGKALRAEPVAREESAGFIHNVGSFPKLESELTTWVPDQGKRSPNRYDAYVFAHRALGGGQGMNLRDL